MRRERSVVQLPCWLHYNKDVELGCIGSTLMNSQGTGRGGENTTPVYRTNNALTLLHPATSENSSRYEVSL